MQSGIFANACHYRHQSLTFKLLICSSAQWIVTKDSICNSLNCQALRWFITGHSVKMHQRQFHPLLFCDLLHPRSLFTWNTRGTLFSMQCWLFNFTVKCQYKRMTSFKSKIIQWIKNWAIRWLLTKNGQNHILQIYCNCFGLFLAYF